MILVGFKTPIVALLLAAFCIVAGLLGHYGQGGDDPTLTFLHPQMLMKDIAIAGGFLALAMAGAGAWSIDGRGSALDSQPRQRLTYFTDTLGPPSTASTSRRLVILASCASRPAGRSP